MVRRCFSGDCCCGERDQDSQSSLKLQYHYVKLRVKFTGQVDRIFFRVKSLVEGLAAVASVVVETSREAITAHHPEIGSFKLQLHLLQYVLCLVLLDYN